MTHRHTPEYTISGRSTQPGDNNLKSLLGCLFCCKDRAYVFNFLQKYPENHGLCIGKTSKCDYYEDDAFYSIKLLLSVSLIYDSVRRIDLRRHLITSAKEVMFSLMSVSVRLFARDKVYAKKFSGDFRETLWESVNAGCLWGKNSIDFRME